MTSTSSCRLATGAAPPPAPAAAVDWQQAQERIALLCPRARACGSSFRSHSASCCCCSLALLLLQLWALQGDTRSRRQATRRVLCRRGGGLMRERRSWRAQRGCARKRKELWCHAIVLVVGDPTRIYLKWLCVSSACDMPTC